jgi:hypothetical protein
LRIPQPRRVLTIVLDDRAILQPPDAEGALTMLHDAAKQGNRRIVAPIAPQSSVIGAALRQ